MDALTRRQFDRSMFAKERTLAIRVGEYASRDIKEASFEYGYIKGDTYKPGGTCAGSGKITFTSIITTFNKLDTLHPEIGLLVGDTYQWVKMGEYFINDIEIDRNRNTTTLELMDGMFKLNREYVTDLHFPAEVREVIQEICLKTGIELANDYFGISAMRYHIEQVPEGKKLSFRDMLSAMTQMIGMSCFFNREGKMEIRDLTESNITINADSYFLHGLTKSEIEYQIAGITCKTDKKSLTVGMKTGRSLELDNVFMTQSALNDLYYKLKNLTYYPYNLNYQGHLLLEVGQWVTIQTNKKETFKVPVLSQSFTFKGGLRGRISADSKAGNDTQYSYEGTITKQIKQQDGIEAKIQAQIEATDKDFDQKVDKIKKDFNDQVELAKARAEEVKRELSDTINQRFNSFDNGPLKETKSKAEEALRNAGASSSLAQESKRIGLDSVARLEAFKSQTTSAQTALSGDLDALKRTIANDIRPKQAQAEAEIAKQVEALSRTKNELAGASTLLAQEAKRIELDSVARLEAFKSQTTSAQTALSGDLDVLKRTIANDIRPKQAQAETEIAKQVEALSRTKNELAGVKSAQATYEETTTRRLSELTNLANGKASKSELTQTAEELSSKIASVQVGGRNYIRNGQFKNGSKNWLEYQSVNFGLNFNYQHSQNPNNRNRSGLHFYHDSQDVANFFGIQQSFAFDGIRGEKVSVSLLVSKDGSDSYSGLKVALHYIKNKNIIGQEWQNIPSPQITSKYKRFTFTFTLSDDVENLNLMLFGEKGKTINLYVTDVQLERGSVATDYKEAPEDIEGQISTVESNFKQRADSLEAGVSRLTEGLRTKVDISALNVTAENIRQSVKSLETDTQNKLNQKLSQAEFEVRAGSIRQEILNATKDKASKSELTQTAEELASRIASVKVGGRNYYRDSEKIRTSTRFFSFPLHPYLSQENVGETWTLSFDLKINEGGEIRPLLFYHYQTNRFGLKASADITPSKEWQRFTFTGPVIFPNDDPRYSRGEMALYDHGGNNNYSVRRIKLEKGTLATDWSPAPEDIEGQISTVESTFKQRANSLEAGVNRLTEGLRTKVDISALNVTAENIRQSVKSLETDTQNKLNQKLSQAEFEVRAGSIRQEILNATKDKADKTLVVSEAGKLREEFSKMKVGGRNLWIKSKTVGAVIEKLPENHVTGQKECYRLENNSTLTFNIEPDFSSRLYQKVTFSAWVKYENVVQGRNFWNVFNCFKHYLFRKNSETGVQSGPDYATLGMYKGSADWKYITFTYDYSEKTNFDQLKTSLRFNLEGATSGTAWVTGIKVEIGSVATDWSPAPEDADGLITEAKATFERTAQGLRTDLSAIQEYVNKDGQRQEALQRYTREESTRQAIAVRELVNRDFVGKATYQEDVKGINQRIEAVKTSANKDIASQIASYRQSVDGKFTDISSQITTYKQDVGGQISGLSNRLTSSEQGTTTQISNLSNRINSNKQGADNQISNLKTQVATNKDNAERQMGRISDQVSANKANADSQFVNVTNQLARKVETTDFQRVKETSKLYERILGNTENGIADKVARMALTNQLFQVEVGKVAKGGRNYIRNGQFKNGSKNWLEYQSVNFGLNFNYQHSQNPNNRNRPGLHFYHDSQDVANFFGIQQSFAFDGIRGEKVSVSLLVSKDGSDSYSGLKVALHYIKNKNIIGQEWQNIPSPQITSKYKRFTFTFTLSDDVENLNLMLFGEKGKTINLYVTDVQLERGSVATDYKEALEDTDEAIRSVQSQLTGSWAVQNINSAGDIISGINLGANGHNRFVGKLTHITGETLIDRAVIKSAMVDKLKTANFEAGSVTTTILDAEAVTAEKLKVDNALIRKLTATDAFIYELISKRIFSTKVESVISSSTFLEAYQGRIGGFTLGQFDQGGGRWISGVNQFSVGMGNGAGHGVRTAFWANWGNNWNYAGPKAWNVNTDGKMYCRNEVGFYDQVDFSNSSRANFYGNTTFSRSPVFSNGIELGSKDVLGDGWNPKGGRNAVVWWNQVGSGSVKYWMEQKSDRRLKENITDTAVKALDKINRLRMVAFDFIENKKHEEIGLIAQEAETIVPRIVSRDPENPDGYLHIDYTALVPYLIKAIQELNQKIEKMEKTIA
ncbi:tail fiber domain-containing protein [Streptococcus pneumoniae]|uniref:tail fiber domain-containing protein n=1 Tax=Streptococcus pneumoniae TaxID=1313 RepID=UPI00226E13C3|nr:tail fiber domain-containing protein [Streptococcus pneumoniae]WAC85259.1 tail fiber domain-containing protein [Streptococcus pneumoniae]WAC87050.1 tail fiber domain-containing protein [Streptococcus pneumoniae]